MRFGHKVLASSSLVAVSAAALAAALFKPGESLGQQAAAPARVTVEGTVTDAVTGEPVTSFIVQSGRFDPADPQGITWGYSHSTSGSRSGRYSRQIDWNGGWTARIVADGYEPQPILTEPPPAGETRIEVNIQLRPGRVVSGRLLRHDGRPAADVAVFTVGPTGLNVADGKALGVGGEEDTRARRVTTDADGRFSISVGEAGGLAFTKSGLIDAWAVPLPEAGQPLEVRLPEAVPVTIHYDIEGADDEGEVFYQLLTHLMPGFERLDVTRRLPIKNGETLTLPTMAPGKYQFARSTNIRFRSSGFGGMLDRVFVELQPGRPQTIDFRRPIGVRVPGTITWPANANVEGVLVSIQSAQPVQWPWSDHADPITFSRFRVGQYDAEHRLTGGPGDFLTERLAPGRYVVKADAYVQRPPAAMRTTGIRGPDLTATAPLVITETGASPASIALTLGGQPEESEESDGG
jgi:hypothetical protein